MKKSFLLSMVLMLGLVFITSNVTQAQAFTKDASPSYSTAGVKALSFQGYLFSQDTLTSTTVEVGNYNPIIKGVKKVYRSSTTPKITIEKFVYGIDGWTKTKTIATADSSSTETFFTDTLTAGNTRYLFIGGTASGDSSVFKFKLEQFIH